MANNNKTKNNTFRNIRKSHGAENTEDYLELINDMLNKTGEARIVNINPLSCLFLFKFHLISLMVPTIKVDELKFVTDYSLTPLCPTY